MQKVSCRVVTRSCRADICFDCCFNFLSNLNATYSHDTLVDKSTARFLGVLNFKNTRVIFEDTCITNLTAAFCIERGLIQHDEGFVTFNHFINLFAIFIDRDNLTFANCCIIAVKLSFTFNFNHAVVVNREFTCITCTLTLSCHFNFKACFING